MQTLCKTVLTVGIAVALNSLTNFSAGQARSQLSSSVSTFTPQLVSQANEKLDLALLAKTGANFFQSDRYQTESEITVDATSNGTNVRSVAKVVTIAQSPNKFRAEISFASRNESPKTNSTVVSDGKKVWIYRSDLNQYTTMPYAKFDQLDDNYWVGMASYWFLAIPPDARKEIANGALADPAVQKELGLSDATDIKGSTQTIDGQTFYTYEYTDKDGNVIGALVDPQKAELKQIVITGKSEGFNVVITERILRRTPNPSTNATTFQSPVPAKAKQVKTLAIGPL